MDESHAIVTQTLYKIGINKKTRNLPFINVFIKSVSVDVTHNQNW